MSGIIFINYRRADEAGTTLALYQRLEAEFGADALFMDVEGHIKAGDDYVDVLRDQVARCDIMLVVIGPRWLSASDENGRPRLENPEDWVRIEISSALAGDKRVIPVLVSEANPPRAEDLPDNMMALARRQAVRVTLERFKADSQGLINQLKDARAEIEKARTAQTEAEKRAAAAATRKRLNEEAQREEEARRQAEERRRLEMQMGLSAEDIRKVEAIQHWDFIKNRDDADALRDHMARFPESDTAAYAKSTLENLVWESLGNEPSIGPLEGFVDEFPKGRHAEKAQVKLDALGVQVEAEKQKQALLQQETEAWARASDADAVEAYETFLRRWPDSEHGRAARKRVRELRGGWGRVSGKVFRGVALTLVVGVLAVGLYIYNPITPTEILSARSVQIPVGLPGSTKMVSIKPGSGQTFQDAPFAPQMVVVPAGRFDMGTPRHWRSGFRSERPKHRVSVKSFAMGRFEVTNQEYVAFLNAVRRRGDKKELWFKTKSEDSSSQITGFVGNYRVETGKENYPVVTVSWYGAKAYVQWLSGQTGKTYRLPTEAEWEYATRGGNDTVFWWGNSISTDQANYYGDFTYGGGLKGVYRGKTVPVNSFKPNPFGLYNVHGNVWEWVEDCWHSSYKGAPTDGSAWLNANGGNCKRRVLRGGSWRFDPQYLRARFRFRFDRYFRIWSVGFRVARAL